MYDGLLSQVSRFDTGTHRGTYSSTMTKSSPRTNTVVARHNAQPPAPLPIQILHVKRDEWQGDPGCYDDELLYGYCKPEGNREGVNLNSYLNPSGATVVSYSVASTLLTSSNITSGKLTNNTSSSAHSLMVL